MLRTGVVAHGIRKRSLFHLFLNFRLGSAGELNVCSHCYDVLNEDDCLILKFDEQLNSTTAEMLVKFQNDCTTLIETWFWLPGEGVVCNSQIAAGAQGG